MYEYTLFDFGIVKPGTEPEEKEEEEEVEPIEDDVEERKLFGLPHIYWIIILIVILILAAIVIFCIWYCCCRSKDEEPKPRDPAANFGYEDNKKVVLRKKSADD